MPKKARSAPRTREKEEVRWLGFTLRGTKRSTFTRHLLILAALAIVTKWCTIIITEGVFSSFIDLFDITYYLKFALRVYGGQIPYVQFPIEYPQGFLLSMLLPLVLLVLAGGMPALLAGDPTGYILLHQGLMVFFDVGSTLLVYIIGLRLYSARRAFSAGVLYATAISASYFVLTKYDAYPTFFLLLSLGLFLYGRETAGYLAGAWGALAKWFPGLALPLYLICDVKRGVKRELILRNLCLSVLLILIGTLPFFLLHPSGFLETYTSRVGAPVLTHSFVFYLDFLAKTLSGPAIFGGISLLLTAIAEIGLFLWYYRQPKKDDLTLSSFLFIAVALFIITNPVASPQYLQWITPFMALFLAGPAWEILLFYAVQIWGYLEFPLLYNRIYNNISGYGPAEAGFPAAAFLFFTVKFALFFLVLGLIIRRTLRAEEEETRGVP